MSPETKKGAPGRSQGRPWRRYYTRFWPRAGHSFALAALLAALPTAAAASAHSPPLSVPQAKVAVGHYLQRDTPDYTIGRCLRHSPTAVSCRFTEQGIAPDGGSDPAWSFSYHAVARRVGGRIVVRLPGWGNTTPFSEPAR